MDKTLPKKIVEKRNEMGVKDRDYRQMPVGVVV